jgi:hypothetical protein
MSYKVGDKIKFKRHNVHNDSVHFAEIIELDEQGLRVLSDDGYWAIDYNEIIEYESN